MHLWHLSLRVDRDIFHSIALPWFLLECCELGFASHLIDLLLDDRILIFHCVLDDLGMFHHRCVDVVLVMHAHDGSQLDPALRYPSFDWSLRVRHLLRDFRNSDDLLLLSTEYLKNLDLFDHLIDLCQTDRRLDQPCLPAPSS